MIRSRSSAFSVSILALALLSACGASVEQQPNGYNWDCKSSSDCGARGGLSCEPLGDFTKAQCSVSTRICTLPCSTAADCAPLGKAFECVKSCGGSAAGMCLER